MIPLYSSNLKQIDLEALEQQCAERNWMESEENRRNDSFGMYHLKLIFYDCFHYSCPI